MQALAEEGMNMSVVTHEMAFARKVGTRLIFMEEGKIAVDGPPAALLANPENPRLREFLQHVNCVRRPPALHPGRRHVLRCRPTAWPSRPRRRRAVSLDHPRLGERDGLPR